MFLAVLQALVSGLVTGCVYALVALSICIVYKSSDLLNFAGGEFVMAGGYLALLGSVAFGLGYAAIFPLVILGAFLIGAAFDRVTLHKVRSLSRTDHAAHVPMIVATLGLSYMLKGAARVIPYTEEPRRLAPLWSGDAIFIGSVVLQRQDVVIVGVTAAIMMGLLVFFRYTMAGKGLRAISQSPRAAALAGMPVSRFRMGAWGLASAIAGIAGILLASKLLVTPDIGSIVMMAFAAAVVGGMTSLPGCVVGGMLIGVLQNLVGFLIAPQAIAITPFFIIMAVLLLRPQGLFGDGQAPKKV
ncbi:MAG TPA: branched-chain amino acid ABC transporter permease [Ramlibacter sp.]|uniref:branched-chain amino acid ABC transporter permease n=1 Tax=Ramlibacter sp. TaxID=1917967 RepID=UPI002CC920A9|nr:branched-chain amino acid ABC transporter permease [Ramlibacter sp.]HVZ42208.1 branched-chain amino acid ABC transporter permease [Ramlibacter sp.]